MYPNGRAKGPGRWYRRSLAVKRQSDEKPLSFDLQVHPMYMTPTSRNPGCVTTRTQYFIQVQMEEWEPRLILMGKGLSRSPKAYRINVEDKVFYTDDPLYGVAFVRAAQHYRHRFVASMTRE